MDINEYERLSNITLSYKYKNLILDSYKILYNLNLLDNYVILRNTKLFSIVNGHKLKSVRLFFYFFIHHYKTYLIQLILVVGDPTICQH